MLPPNLLTRVAVKRRYFMRVRGKAHGMPFPQNLSTAVDVEAVVRQHGATPATIAIIRGNIHVGLEQAELQLLAEEGARLPKLCQVGALVKGNFTTSMDSTNTASHKDRDVALGYEQRHVIWNCTRQHK